MCVCVCGVCVCVYGVFVIRHASRVRFLDAHTRDFSVYFVNTNVCWLESALQPFGETE